MRRHRSTSSLSATWLIIAALLLFSAGSCAYGLYIEGAVARRMNQFGEVLP